MVQEDGDNLLREFKGELYCIFCLDETGKPLITNEVRNSIRSFWARRELEDELSKSNAG